MFWSEQTKSTREQRQEQYVRKEEVEKALQPVKAAYEASMDSLSSLQEEDVSIKYRHGLVPAACNNQLLGKERDVLGLGEAATGSQQARTTHTGVLVAATVEVKLRRAVRHIASKCSTAPRTNNLPTLSLGTRVTPCDHVHLPSFHGR